ncbi:MAG TPA: LCCL domain-containing protein [Kofleriaceae bacterium]|nr:LCCL domain-containing protein [Kofleriaceae bacterium]
MKRSVATISMFALCIATSCVVRPPTLTARTPSFAAAASAEAGPGPGPAPGPEPAGEAPLDNNQPIDAGCTFSAQQIKAEPGSLHQVSCPAGCDKDDYLWGTDTYSSESHICASAIHAGVIPQRGGVFTLQLGGAKPAFRGSKRNGIESRDGGESRGSFRFQGVVAAAPPPPGPARPGTLEPGCTFKGNEIKAEPGTAFRVSCPADCNVEPRPIWGTDVYTGDSPVCVAAIHAGVSSERGGEFTLTVEPGRPAYRGGKRHGITSQDWGTYRVSFRLSP